MSSKACHESSGLVKTNCSIYRELVAEWKRSFVDETYLLELVDTENPPCILAVGASFLPVASTVTGVPGGCH